MHRIDTATKAADLFGAGKDGFKDGNKAAGIAATDLTAAFFNDVQENIAQVIEVSGDALTKGDGSQLLTALVKKGAQGSYFNTAAAGGTADAITATFTPAITALTNGMMLYVRAGGANTTATPTFTPAAGVIAPATIVKVNNQPLALGDIAGSGHWCAFKYDTVLGKWVLLNPATGGSIRTFVDVSATKEVDTNYTNSSGRDWVVYAYGVTFSPNGFVSLSIDGDPFCTSSQPSNASGVGFCVVVPAGRTYKVSLVGVTLNRWHELR